MASIQIKNILQLLKNYYLYQLFITRITMKKNLRDIILLCGMIFFTVVGLKAQITITKSNMPLAGQNYIYSSSTDSVDVTTTGANKTWDFSGVIPTSQDTYKYVAAAKANILYALSFSGDAALEIKTAGLTGAYDFFKTTASEYTQAGLGITIPVINVPTPIVYSSPDVIYRLPLTYSDKDSASFAGSATISSFSIKIAGKRINIVDGWGTIKTPYKTYSCIRVKSIVHEEDTFLTQGIKNDRIEYKWLSKSENIPVFESVVTANATGGGTSQALYYRDSFKNIVNPNGPVVAFDAPDTNLFLNDSVQFNNMTTGALRYTWVISPSTYSFVAKTTDTSKKPYVKFSAYGLYTVSLNALGLGGSNNLTRTKYISVTHNTGIDPANNENDALKIYPNPANGEVYLHFSNGLNGNTANISLANIFGQTILQQTVAPGQTNTHLSLSGMAPGVYFVIYNNGGQNYTGKVEVR